MQVGLRLVEDFRQRVRTAIIGDPILPVAQHWERELSEIKVSMMHLSDVLPTGWMVNLLPQETMEGETREEFIAMCPSLLSMYSIMYT